MQNERLVRELDQICATLPMKAIEEPTTILSPSITKRQSSSGGVVILFALVGYLVYMAFFKSASVASVISVVAP